MMMVDIIPLMPQMAFEEKGKVPFRAKHVIGSTNIPHLHTAAYMAYPIATMRRISVYIHLTVKDEYAENARLCVTQDDVIKAQQAGEFQDWWNIDIWRWYTDGGHLKHETINHFSDMSEFLKWYGKKIIEQFEDQKRVIANLKTHKDIEFCNSCFSYKHKCECEKPSEVPRDLSFTEVRNFTPEECDRYADFLTQDRFLFQDEDTFLPEPFNPEKYTPQSNTSSCGVVNRIERIDFISYCQFIIIIC
jgi:hypothetical protein